MNKKNSRYGIISFFSAIWLSIGLMFLFSSFGNVYTPYSFDGYGVADEFFLLFAGVFIVVSIVFQFFALFSTIKGYNKNLISRDYLLFVLALLVFEITMLIAVLMTNSYVY